MSKFKVVAQLIWGSGICQNVFYCNATTTNYPALVASTGVWVADCYGNVNALMTNQIHGDKTMLFEKVGADWLFRGEQAWIFLPLSINNPLPRQSAGVVIAKTSVKRCVGRKFIPGITEIHQDGGVVSEAALGMLRSFGADWIFGQPAADIPLEAGVYNAASDTVVPFVGYHADVFMGSQRRRKQGVGI